MFFASHTHVHRVLLVWRDQYMSMHQQGLTLWGREEALGAVTSSLFVELPAAAPSGKGEAGKSKTDFSQFLRVQILSVKVCTCT